MTRTSVTTKRQGPRSEKSLGLVKAKRGVALEEMDKGIAKAVKARYLRSLER